MEKLRHPRSLCACVAVCGALVAFSAAPAQAEKLEDSPVYIEAEEMHYEQDRNVVTATGHVEVVQGERILRSDTLSYNKSTGIVMAAGNVSILEPNGNVYFAQEVRLKDDLKEGVAKQLRARLSDNSLVAATEGRRVNEYVTELDNAVYSPCKICHDETTGESKDPLWQLKADKITIDESEEWMHYRNAWLEMYGVPVLYTPYFSHPTPNAGRQSGLLTPTFSVSSSLGATTQVPYYVNIAPEMDATLTPMLTTDEGPVMIGAFRHLTAKGQYEIGGSITNPQQRDPLTGEAISGRDLRGHLKGEGRFEMSDHWAWGFNGKWASNDTYLRRYDFGNEDSLTSRVYIEGIDKRNYTSVEGLAFQGLNIQDDPATTPFILPHVTNYYESAPTYAGGRAFVESGAMLLYRSLGAESRRVSLSGGWKRSLLSSGGQAFDVTAALHSDGYSLNNTLTSSGTEDTYAGRLLPELSVAWRYPLIAAMQRGAITLEPTAAVIVSPYGSNPDEIPNEDSQVLEFSDSNLFNTNRSTGRDRVESGPRVNYGLRGSLNLDADRYTNFLFGQSYRLKTDNSFAFGDNPDDLFSDYVGRITTYYDRASLSYRFRLAENDFTPRRNELNAWVDLNPVGLDLTYISLNNDPNLSDRRELAAAASYALSERWTLVTNGRRDLSENGGMITGGGGLVFTNECLSFLINLNREFTRDRDIEPATSLTFRISLKNLAD